MNLDELEQFFQGLIKKPKAMYLFMHNPGQFFDEYDKARGTKKGDPFGIGFALTEEHRKFLQENSNFIPVEGHDTGNTYIMRGLSIEYIGDKQSLIVKELEHAGKSFHQQPHKGVRLIRKSVLQPKSTHVEGTVGYIDTENCRALIITSSIKKV